MISRSMEETLIFREVKYLCDHAIMMISDVNILCAAVSHLNPVVLLLITIYLSNCAR